MKVTNSPKVCFRGAKLCVTRKEVIQDMATADAPAAPRCEAGKSSMVINIAKGPQPQQYPKRKQISGTIGEITVFSGN